ncbi:MAG: glycosyltransferase family 4 protein [Candidatus Omnitrophica bacterium]|nr:glycosyltransferase family 4 protein [Candidatus Omnitrophota bacterium]MDD5440805.1 glycosyltransferase family 4 protein [Candidatus Omnitrophota bacterium]
MEKTKEKYVINVCYLDFLEKESISSININKTFLDYFSEYVNVKIISFSGLNRLEEFFRRINEDDFDYLYVDGFTFLIQAFLIREKFGLNIPFIVKLHSMFAWLYKYTYIVPLLREEDIIYAPCEYAKQSFLHISEKNRVHVMYNFVDNKKIQKVVESDICRRPVDKTITFMGRLVASKGIGLLIDIMPGIISKVKNVSLKIIGPLSGTGIDDNCKSDFVHELEEKVKRLEISKHVIFEGVKFGDEKYELLFQSDIFVNPTITPGETFPFVNIEALACGVPVITTDWGGNKELIKDEYNGYLLQVLQQGTNGPEISKSKLIDLITGSLLNEPENFELKHNAFKTAAGYDYRKVFPVLTKLLKKRKKKYRDNNESWNDIKEKTVMDFSDCFTNDFIFFLNCQYNFRVDKYKDLYNWVVHADFNAMKGLVRMSNNADVKQKRWNGLIRDDFIKIFHTF